MTERYGNIVEYETDRDESDYLSKANVDLVEASNEIEDQFDYLRSLNTEIKSKLKKKEEYLEKLTNEAIANEENNLIAERHPNYLKQGYYCYAFNISPQRFGRTRNKLVGCGIVNRDEYFYEVDYRNAKSFRISEELAFTIAKELGIKDPETMLSEFKEKNEEQRKKRQEMFEMYKIQTDLNNLNTLNEDPLF